MKKKLLLACCTVALVLSACGGGSSSNTTEASNTEAVEENTEKETVEVATEAQANAETVSEEADGIEAEQNATDQSTSSGPWSSNQTVDEFGDVVEDSKSVVQATFNGTFSNSATSGSDLAVTVFFTENNGNSFGYIGSIRLKEYGDSPATYLSSEVENLKLKMKVGETVKEYPLKSLERNSDLWIGTEGNVTDADCIMADLARGEDIKCVINIGNSKYNFTIESANFKDVCSKVWGRTDTQSTPDLANYKWNLSDTEYYVFYDFDIGFCKTGDQIYGFNWQYAGNDEYDIMTYMGVLGNYYKTYFKMEETDGKFILTPKDSDLQIVRGEIE